MEFNWINIFGAIIVILILIPNIIYAIRIKDNEKADADMSKAVLILEQVGRYGCIVFMWLPLFVWKFAFRSGTAFVIYLILNAVLVIAYYVIWIFYTKHKTLKKAMALALIPTAIFLFSGIILVHWCLIIFAVIFGIPHCLITFQTHK